MEGECEPVVYVIYAMRKVLGISRFGDLSIRLKGLASHRPIDFSTRKPPDTTVTESLLRDVHKTGYVTKDLSRLEL